MWCWREISGMPAQGKTKPGDACTGRCPSRNLRAHPPGCALPRPLAEHRVAYILPCSSGRVRQRRQQDAQVRVDM
jgi:hypothetical protein